MTQLVIGLMKNYNHLLKKIAILCLFLFGQSLWAFGDTTPQQIKVKISETDSAYAIVRILDPNLPTLILLPGIFRGFLLEEDYLKVLNRRKLNWVAWHTSRHPESLMTGNQNPWFHQVTSQELAAELVILKRALKINSPILVSLSYSASLIPFVDPRIFPVVVETAPMGQALENNPPPPYYQAWRQWMGMFPVWGNFIIANQEYWAYRGFWLQQTVDLTKTHPQYAPFQRQISEGLAQLAYAGRSFDLRNQDFAKGPRRFWILGQHENRVRKAIQLQAVQLYEKQTGLQGSMVEIEDAGHVIPNENTQAYVKVLSELVQKLSK
jgi:hypothetical protein